MLWQGQSQVKAKDNTVALCHRGLDTLDATVWVLLCKLLTMAADSLEPHSSLIATTTACSASSRAAGSPSCCRAWSRTMVPRQWSTTRSRSGSRRRSYGRKQQRSHVDRAWPTRLGHGDARRPAFLHAGAAGGGHLRALSSQGCATKRSGLPQHARQAQPSRGPRRAPRSLSERAQNWPLKKSPGARPRTR